MTDKKKKRLGISHTKILWVVLPALMVFVSITSFIAGMNLNTTKQPMGRIIDTIIISPDQKLQSLDISGRLTYSDGSPYANQLLELHSTPVQTKTDADGRFTFSQVALGSHMLYLLDKGGAIVSSLDLYVERTPNEKSGSVGLEGESYRIVAGIDTTALFLKVQLAPDHKMKIEKEVLALISDGTVKNQDGEIIGTAVDFPKEIIEKQTPVPSNEGLTEPETVSEETYPEATAEVEQPGTGESGQEHLPPGQTSAIPDNESSSGATQPTETAEVPKEESGDSDSDSSGTKPTKPPKPESTEPMESITVSDDKNEAWTQNTTIDLFANRTGIGPERKLAPGSEGSYQFQVANGSKLDVYYTITMEKGANQKYLLPLKYRLKSGNEYIGGISTWLTAEQLKDSQVALGTEETCRYTLEWQWPYEGGNDKLDTMIGMSDHLEYELVVKIRITQS